MDLPRERERDRLTECDGLRDRLTERERRERSSNRADLNARVIGLAELFDFSHVNYCLHLVESEIHCGRL